MENEYIKSHMQIALSLAEAVKGSTAPNPAVGAVVVKDGIVIGEGATSPAGGPHAEVHAIESAGAECRGADLFVTLEPCSHFGKTPPCADAVIRAGFKRVFVAVLDPNPHVAGKGVGKIKSMGIEVHVGACAKEATRVNEDFFHYITTGKPWITVKIAMTLDGRVADTTGSSKWITGEESRAFVHKLRSQYSAIAVGTGTLTADNPQLTVRAVEGKNPIRIIFSSSRDIDEESYFYQNAHEVRSIVVVSGGDAPLIEKEDNLEFWHTGKEEYGESLQQFMVMAGEQEIDSILIEGGAKLVSTLMSEKLVNRFYIFYAPKILGGGQDGLFLPTPEVMESIIKVHEPEYTLFGEDMMVTGLIQK